MKYMNFKRYKFSTAIKSFNTAIYNFLKNFKFLDPRKYDLKKFFKYISFKKFNLDKIRKYSRLDTYKFSNLKRVNLLSSDFFVIHLPAFIIFFGFLYLAIPTFYNYDKSSIKKILCKNSNLECIIKGKVKYRFYPTPRLKIEDLVVKELKGKKYTFAKIKDVSIKLSFKNLLAKEKHKFKKIELNNFEANLDLKNLKKYKNIFEKKFNLVPLTLNKGTIMLFEGNNYLASITNADIKTTFKNSYIESELDGKFLDDNIYININREDVNNDISTNLIFKMKNFNFLTKANFVNSKKNKDNTSGNFLIKKDKNKFTGIFDFKDNEFIIKKSNLRNTFMDGKIEGKIILLPYFNFDLDLALNSINFTRLYNYFLVLDPKDQKNLFKISNKINGKINFSTDKVYSKHNLVKSFESRLKFYNGNIKIDQFLINLGKLGAADILGLLSNDKKFSGIKFDSNIFVDNKKKFSSKFGIYKKENIPSNLFISGNFDLDNIRASFYEISTEKKISAEDLDYVESEFNDVILEEGFKYLFNFQKFKVFLKSVIDEKN